MAIPTILLLWSILARDVTSQKLPSFEDFDHYMTRFQKQYKDDELQERKAIYEARINEIFQHNSRPGVEWLHAVNKFADARPEERKRSRQRSAKHTGRHPFKPVVQGLPPALDWRNHSPPVLTEVRDQEPCGDCWARAGTAALEAHLAITTGELLRLSSQHVSDCGSRKMNKNHSCNFGGFAKIAFKHATHNGVPLEDDYPRLPHGAKCKLRKAPLAVGAKGFGSPRENKAWAFLQALQNGPVAVGVASETWDPYSHGIYSGCSSIKGRSRLDHEVLLVGYGQENGNQYWIVQNSWGTDWGEDGFIRLKRYVNEPCKKDADSRGLWNCGECGLLADASYPVGVFQRKRRLVGDILV